MPHIEFDTIDSARLFYALRRQRHSYAAAARMSGARITGLATAFADCQFGGL